jgi:hypothetical protein
VFTLEFVLVCLPGTRAAPMSSVASGLSKCPLIAECLSQSVYPEMANVQDKAVSQVSQRVEEVNRTLSSAQMEDLKDLSTLPAGLSALRPCPEINHTVGRRRL